MTDHDARVLEAWFDASEIRGSRAALERALAATKGQPQRPGWLVSIRGGTIATNDSRRRLLALTLVATVALVAAIVGGAIVGGPIVRPVPSPTQPTQTPAPAPSPTQGATLKERGGLVAFTHVEDLERGVECPSYDSSLCHVPRLWVSNPDGSNAHELLPRVEGRPLVEGRQTAVGWSPNGRWLLFDAFGTPTLTDPTGSEIRELNVEGESFAFSPDSTRLAFVRAIDATDRNVGTQLAILEIATGRVTVLKSTRSRDSLGSVAWSPDGEWIAFDRQTISIPFGGGWIYIVRPDGSDLRSLTVDPFRGIAPAWSLDGATIAFTSPKLVNDAPPQMTSDIYTLRLGDLAPVRLTSDRISAVPSWTLDGRIVFRRIITQGEAEVIELWVMNADGSGAERLDASNVAALSEIGCVACEGDFWQPTP
jgi:Tol biopolymer transport system component